MIYPENLKQKKENYLKTISQNSSNKNKTKKKMKKISQTPSNPYKNRLFHKNLN